MGAYKPGERLGERELAGQCGVSPIPGREALQVLENRGLVRRRRNRSCSVIELTPDELRQVAELRALLEPQMVRWACERMNSTDLLELEDHLARLRRTAEDMDVPRFFYVALHFHQLLWSKSGNHYAAETLSRALGSLFACGLMRAEGETPPALKAEVRKHEELVEALRAKKASEAARILTRIAEEFNAQLARRNEETK